MRDKHSLELLVLFQEYLNRLLVTINGRDKPFDHVFESHDAVEFVWHFFDCNGAVNFEVSLNRKDESTRENECVHTGQ